MHSCFQYRLLCISNLGDVFNKQRSVTLNTALRCGQTKSSHWYLHYTKSESVAQRFPTGHGGLAAGSWHEPPTQSPVHLPSCVASGVISELLGLKPGTRGAPGGRQLAPHALCHSCWAAIKKVGNYWCSRQTTQTPKPVLLHLTQWQIICKKKNQGNN